MPKRRRKKKRSFAEIEPGKRDVTDAKTLTLVTVGFALS